MLAAITGCSQLGGPTKIALIAAPDMMDLAAARSGEPDEQFKAPGGPIDLVAAANETVAFRLWVTNGGILPAEVSIAPGEWKGEDGAVLAAASVQIYRAHRVRVPSWPGWHVRLSPPESRREWVEDVLVPAHAPEGGLPARVTAKEPLALWADVIVPKDAKPGIYLAELAVGAGSKSSPVTSLPMRLQVLPVVLPDRAEVVLTADLDHQQLFAHHVTYEGRPYRPGRVLTDSPVRGELQAVLDAGMRMLQSHGVSPLLPTLYPIMKIDADGEVTVRWNDYDALVSGYLDGTRFPDRAPLPVWAVPFDESFPAPPSKEALESPAYAGYLRKYVAECARHFTERGWISRAFARIPHAAEPSRTAVTAGEHFARIIRRAAPDLRILSDLFPQDMSSYGWPGFPAGDLAGDVDIWRPRAQFFPSPRDRAGLAPGQAFWMRLDRPPFSGSLDIAAGPADARVIPWQGRREDAGVVHLGTANPWPPPHEGFGRLSAQECMDQAAGSGGATRDCPLIYPGGIAGLNEPVASVRLKLLRRGMQDMAWLRLLKDRGAEHIAEVLADSLSPFAASRAYLHHYADGLPGGWLRDPRAWREAERIIKDEARGLEGRMERMAGAVRWRRFMESARQVRVKVEAARVRVVGQGPKTQALVDCGLRLHNGSREPAGGTAAFGPLPVGWTSPAAGVGFGPAPPGGSARIVLTAAAGAIPSDEDGVQYLPVELSAEGSDGSAPQKFSVRLASIAAQPLVPSASSAKQDAAPARPGRRIRIDGELGDWPTAAGNLASDFVLITGEDAASPSETSARPAGRTRVSVAADAEALYFAFECAFGDRGAPAALPAGHTNTVGYEDGIPVGDELVEIILDPTAAGTHSPADLYHVVVKPGGAMWERGIGFDPPVGKRESWAADIQHAAQVRSDRWTAEVRIPLPAFGAGATRQRIWAVNFARFDARAQEYSNWSGAVGNFYDPASAGNLALP